MNKFPRMPKLTLVTDACFPTTTRWGEFDVLVFQYTDNRDRPPLFALKKGNLAIDRNVWVRVHSSCMTSETLGALDCDCADQLHCAMEEINRIGQGLVIYLPQEARGNGLLAKFRIYSWMWMHKKRSVKEEASTVLGYDYDRRTYEDAAAILQHLSLTDICLLTNNPDKVSALRAYGINVEVQNLRVPVTEYNRAYLLEKQFRHHHDLGLEAMHDLWCDRVLSAGRR